MISMMFRLVFRLAGCEDWYQSLGYSSRTYVSKEEPIKEEPLEESNEEVLESKEDHEVHLKLVLEPLKKEKLFAKFSKYEFWLQEVRFLGHVVSSNDIHVDSSKIEAMKDQLMERKECGVYCDTSNQGLGCVLMQRDNVENATAEMLCGLDQLMERKECGVDKTYYDLRDMYGGHYWTDANLHAHVEEIKVDKTLCFAEELVEIIDRESCYVAISTLVWVSEVVSSGFPIVKVRRDSKRGPKFTWERGDHMKVKYFPMVC
ncbi:hypothetical protein Tco_1301862 [Tanacetum coccineum]